MSKNTDDWNSFWDLTSPAEAARLLREQYGTDAADAAARCAETACGDGRETDQQFWLAVLANLRGNVS